MSGAANGRLTEAAAGERRADKRLIAHWQQVRRESSVPTLQDMSLGDHTGIREASFLLLIGDTPADSIIVLCGERVECEDLRAALGQTLSSMRESVVRDALCRLCDEARTARRPVSLAGSYWDRQGQFVRYRLGCVPLRADDAPIPSFSYILGSFARKLVPPG